MAEDSKNENTDTNTDKRLANLKPPWKPGEAVEGAGRPKGQRNYATIYREALIKLAKLNDKSPEELEDEIVSAGLLNARKGNYAFYKDVLDRTHGQAAQKHEMSGELNITVTTFDEHTDTTPI
jgi:hypothetical protein